LGWWGWFGAYHYLIDLNLEDLYPHYTPKNANQFGGLGSTTLRILIIIEVATLQNSCNLALTFGTAKPTKNR